jgi:hypothetical protein
MTMVGNVVCSLFQPEWFFSFCQSGARAKNFTSPFTQPPLFLYFKYPSWVSLDYCLSLRSVYVVLTNFPLLIFLGGQIVKYKIFVGFFMDKIVHEERCKIFCPQNCWLVLICTNFRAQNHWLVLIAPHGLAYFFKKFQTMSKIWKCTPGFYSWLPFTSCFDLLTISVLVWTSRLFQHKIMVRLYCLSPLQLFLLAMVDSNSPHLSSSFPFAISLWRTLVFHFHLLVLSCHVLLTATVIFCQDGISK